MFGTKYNYLVWLIYQLFLYLSVFYLKIIIFLYVQIWKSICVLMNFSFASFVELSLQVFTSFSTAFFQQCFSYMQLPFVIILSYFGSALGNIAWGLSTDQTCKVGAMIEDNIASTNSKNPLAFVAKVLKERKKWSYFAMVGLS